MLKVGDRFKYVLTYPSKYFEVSLTIVGMSSEEINYMWDDGKDGRIPIKTFMDLYINPKKLVKVNTRAEALCLKLAT